MVQLSFLTNKRGEVIFSLLHIIPMFGSILHIFKCIFISFLSTVTSDVNWVSSGFCYLLKGQFQSILHVFDNLSFTLAFKGESQLHACYFMLCLLCFSCYVIYKTNQMHQVDFYAFHVIGFWGFFVLFLKGTCNPVHIHSV